MQQNRIVPPLNCDATVGLKENLQFKIETGRRFHFWGLVFFVNPTFQWVKKEMRVPDMIVCYEDDWYNRK